MVRARIGKIYKLCVNAISLHTYLDGVGPFKDPGLRAVEIPHSTATLSAGGGCSLYGLRLMHRPNIFLPSHRLSMGKGGLLFLSFFRPNPNPSVTPLRVTIASVVLCHDKVK